MKKLIFLLSLVMASVCFTGCGDKGSYKGLQEKFLDIRSGLVIGADFEAILKRLPNHSGPGIFPDSYTKSSGLTVEEARRYFVQFSNGVRRWIYYYPENLFESMPSGTKIFGSEYYTKRVGDIGRPEIAGELHICVDSNNKVIGWWYNHPFEEFQPNPQDIKNFKE